MRTISTIKDLVEGLKNRFRDLTDFEYFYDQLRARKDPNGTLSDLTEILWCIL